MNIDKNDITILIQGPLNEVSLKNIENYNKFGHVLISTWDKMNENELKLKKEIELNSFGKIKKMVMTTPPNIEDYPGLSNHKSTTFHYALQGVCDGLKECDTEYVVRVRSDEYFENLKPIIDLFSENKDKLICTNVFFRHEIDYHFGDHIFMSKTSNLKKAYLNLISNITGKEIETVWDQKAHYPEADGIPEVILGKSITLSLTGELSPTKFEECVLEVNVNDLEKFLIRNNHTGQLWVDDYDGNPFDGGRLKENTIYEDYKEGILWKTK